MVTECDATSDYQGLVGEDEVPKRTLEAVSEIEEMPAAVPPALPEGWVEMTDPASGRVYYSNGLTGETTWDRPAAEEGRPVDDVDASQPAPLDEQVAVLEETARREEEVVQHQDVTAESEAAADVEAEEPPAEEVVVDADGPSLPENWQELADPSSGRVYYYNCATQETTWDRPGVEQSAVETAEGQADGAADIEPSDDTSVDREEAAPIETIQDEDEAVVVEPASELLEDIDEPEDDGSQAHEVVEPRASDHGPLPQGWEEVEDPSSGRVYFFNQATGESTWDRPTVEPALAEEAEDCLVESDALAEEAEAGVPDTSPDDHPDGQAVVQDEPAMEEEPQEELAEEKRVPTPSAEEDVPDEVPIQPTTEEGEDSATTALPENWSAVTDPNSMRTYYYNSVTNETTWDRPTEQSPTQDGAQDGGSVEEMTGHDVEPVESEDVVADVVEALTDTNADRAVTGEEDDDADVTAEPMPSVIEEVSPPGKTTGVLSDFGTI